MPTIWALLTVNIVEETVSTTGLWLWRPVWRPSFRWDPQRMKYFIRFGSRNVAALFLRHSLDKLDNVWTSVFLGDVALGFYSRAYKFALYPARMFAPPITMVAHGTFAELKYDKERLSKAFFRSAAVLLRVGLLAAGLLAEGIGAQWALGGFATALVLLSILAIFFIPRIRKLD